jgi:hypothetical protein
LGATGQFDWPPEPPVPLAAPEPVVPGPVVLVVEVLEVPPVAVDEVPVFELDPHAAAASTEAKTSR